jgi:hypothetical protein
LNVVTLQLLSIIVVHLRRYDKPLSQRPVLLHKDITLTVMPGPHMTNWTSYWLRCYGWEVMDHPPYCSALAPSDFHLFRTCNKHLAGKLFVAGANMKQAVTSWLQTLDKDLLCVVQPQWDKCLNVSGDYVEL